MRLFTTEWLAEEEVVDDGLSFLSFFSYLLNLFFFVSQQTEQLTNDKTSAFAFGKYTYRSSSSDCTTYCIHHDNISQGMFFLLRWGCRFSCFFSSTSFFRFPSSQKPQTRHRTRQHRRRLPIPAI